MSNKEITLQNENGIAESNDNSNVQTALTWSTIQAIDTKSKLTIAAMLNAAESLNGHEGEEFTIKEVFFKPGVRRGRNGAPDMPCSDTYLLTDDGLVYFTKSEGVSRSIRNLLMLMPDCNKPDGIKVKFDSMPLQNGNTYKQLVPVIK